jgi:hypothetical protein
MPAGYTLKLDGQPLDDHLHSALSAIEVEENADLPDAIKLTFAVSAVGGEYDAPNSPGLGPLANVTVVAAPDDGDTQCIFDGYVLAHDLHVTAGGAGGRLTVWGQDSSWMLNLAETVREWVGVSDATVANQIFADNQITPADENLDDDTPEHAEDGFTLMQRDTDIGFLRSLARRSGKLCRVVCRDAPGEYVGIFARPKLDGDPVATIKLNDPEHRTTDALDFSWDVGRPSEVLARQALRDDDAPEGASGDATTSGLPALDERDLPTFAGSAMTVLLAAPVDDPAELLLRSQAVLSDGGWFARCEGETDVARAGRVLRVGDVVALEGVGSVNSGKYLVWSLRHSIDATGHRMRFVLYRNAVGPAPSGGAGGLF